MAEKLSPGQRIWFVENGNRVKEGVIRSVSSSGCVVQYPGNAEPAAVRLRANRLYTSEEEAWKVADPKNKRHGPDWERHFEAVLKG